MAKKKARENSRAFLKEVRSPALRFVQPKKAAATMSNASAKARRGGLNAFVPSGAAFRWGL
jgi:hypothetical protein